MEEWNIFLRIILAIGLGALVGTEREKFAKKRDRFVFGGIRTFTLIALLGALSGLFFLEGNEWVLVLSFPVLAVFIGISYHHSVYLSKGEGFGLTSEISALLVFLCGFMVFTKHVFLGIATAIIIATFLYLKERLHALLTKIKEEEVYSTLVFAIILFVVLPFLPNKTYGPLDVFNPYQTWFMVVLICGISYIGYFLVRIFGSKKGIGMTGFLGGLVSSTAVTMAMAQKSKDDKNKNSVNMLIFGTVIANTVMFIRVAVTVFIINSTLLKQFLPSILAMALTGAVSCAIIWYMGHKSESNAEVVHKSPFTIGPALKFGAFFVVVLFSLKIAQMYFGNTGIYVASMLSGFVDVDAVTLSMAAIAGIEIAEKVAATSIMLAVISNSIIKMGYSFVFGSKEFSRKLSLIMIIMVVLGVLALFVF